MTGHSSRALGLAALLIGLSAQIVHAVPPSYPSPPPDFAHPSHPHEELYSSIYAGASRTIPTLVIYTTFTDVPDRMSVEQVASNVFGRTGGVAAYLDSASGFRNPLGPARESNGTANDGVVQTRASTAAAYMGARSGAGGQIATALIAADPHFDFSQYDTNDNGWVETTEICLLVIRTALPTTPPPPAQPNLDNGGAVRSPGTDGWPGDRDTFDGKRIAAAAVMTTATNRMTIAHEWGHLAYFIPDHYGFGVGPYALSGPTIGGEYWTRPSLYERMHLGWQRPEVVTRDGYREIGTFDGLVVYDAGRPGTGPAGPQDYLLLEHRRSTTSFDANVPDQGLIAWRVSEDLPFAGGPEWPRSIRLMRPDETRVFGCSDDDFDGRSEEDLVNGIDDDRDGAVDEDPMSNGCYGGSDTDAWDPSDPRTAGRTILDRWMTPMGAATRNPMNVAVRAIWPVREGRVRAFVDVRGPGFMVDPYALDGVAQGAPGETLTLGIPVRNTQDAAEPGDVFDVSIAGPPGFSSSVHRLTLPAARDGLATVRVTIPRDEPAGTVTLRARGRSTSDPTIGSDVPFRIRIVPVPRTPDRFEAGTGNDSRSTATPISLDTHTHYNPAASRWSERWSTTVTGLSLHNESDRDVFRFAIPGHANPAAGGHSELSEYPECGLGGDSFARIVYDARMSVRMLPPPRNAVGEPVEVLVPFGGDSGPRRVFSCPATALAEQGETTARVAIGTVSTPRVNFPEYDLGVDYLWERRIIPGEHAFIEDLAQAMHAEAFILPPCAGGSFPGCVASQRDPKRSLRPFDLFTLIHPQSSRVDCKQGCSQFTPFTWAGGAFTLSMTGLANASLSIWTLDGDVIATAGKSGKPKQAPMSISETSEEPVTIDLVDLPAGEYLLGIDGEAGQAEMLFAPPADPLTVSIEAADPTVTEPAGDVDAVVTFTAGAADVEILDVTANAAMELSGCTLPLVVDAGASTACTATVTATGVADETVAVSVEVKADAGGPLTRTAAFDVTVLDAPPLLEAAIEVESFLANDAISLASATITLTNRDATEPIRLTSLTGSTWIDADGDGDEQAGETTNLDLLQGGVLGTGVPSPVGECMLVTLAPGESIACGVSRIFTGVPAWGDPVLTVHASGVGVADDGVAEAEASDGFDVTPVFASSVAHGPIEFDVVPAMTTEDDVSGYVLVEAGRDDIDGRTTLASSGFPGPALVEDVLIDVSLRTEGGVVPVESACVQSLTYPLVIDGSADLRFVCALPFEVPTGSSIEVQVTPVLHTG